VTGSSRAVFLSYASQDAAVAQKICDALRAASVQVRFDKSELRGGDSWDQKIRHPPVDPLRREPRFQAIERELKFPN
jgi:hypothetical protein